MTLYDLSRAPRAGTAASRPGRLRIAREQQAVDLEATEQAVTSALHGLLRDDARSRQEFFALTGITP